MLAGLLLTTLLLAASEAPQEPTAPPDDFRPDPAWKTLGRSLWFDPAQKRLVLRARVALREGYLEHLLCLEQTKEHESILATDAVPRMIHAGLLLTGAEVGHPVAFQPEFKPPAGTPIRIDLEWKDESGKLQRARARDWVKDSKTDKVLERDWVFAGSQLFEQGEPKKTLYAADGGDLITVANFNSAILDVPFASSADDLSRAFVAHTERIPPRGTRVTLYLQPAPKAP
jgi:hypothetical protein